MVVAVAELIAAAERTVAIVVGMSDDNAVLVMVGPLKFCTKVQNGKLREVS